MYYADKIVCGLFAPVRRGSRAIRFGSGKGDWRRACRLEQLVSEQFDRVVTALEDFAFEVLCTTSNERGPVPVQELCPDDLDVWVVGVLCVGLRLRALLTSRTLQLLGVRGGT